MSSNIPIRNMYYMLAYAFRILYAQEYKDVDVEEFKNTADLCAGFLTEAVAELRKRGLVHGYTEQTEALSSPHGRIDVTGSINTLSMLRNRLVCEFDDFNVNEYLNRILKTTMLHLLAHPDVTDDQKSKLRREVLALGDIRPLDPDNINWQIRYNRSNQAYQMPISLCRWMLVDMSQTTAVGARCLMDFRDEKVMHSIYEKFLLGYYEETFRNIRDLDIGAKKIPWACDSGSTNDLLPQMQSDVMLSTNDRVLIIDAKYYEKMTDEHYGKPIQKTHNIYQIFAYVKNMAAAKHTDIAPQNVAGMLLYARTDEETLPDRTYSILGNKIAVKSLDLNQEFDGIRAQLDGIVCDYFGLRPE